jgi:hypothetical protein
MSSERLYTPAEVAALVAAGQEAMREAAAVLAADRARQHRSIAEDAARAPGTRERAWVSLTEATVTADQIRALPIPDAPAALARIEAEAEARGMERAAGIVERVAMESGNQECCGRGCSDGYGPPECCGEPDLMVADRRVTAAIRAAKEGKP